MRQFSQWFFGVLTLPLLGLGVACGPSEADVDPVESPFQSYTNIYEVSRYEQSTQGCDNREDALESLEDRTYMAGFTVYWNERAMLRLVDCTSLDDCSAVIGTVQSGTQRGGERWITVSEVISDTELGEQEALGGFIGPDGQCTSRLFTTIRVKKREGEDLLLDIQYFALPDAPLAAGGACPAEFYEQQAEAAEMTCTSRETFWLTPAAN